MKIRRDFLATRDIDWFCIVSGIPIQVASAGGIVLPDLVNDRQKMIDSQIIVSELPSILNEEEIYINKELIRKKLSEEDELIENGENKNLLLDISMEERIAYYAHSFVPYAMKGFFCFDRSEPEKPESTLYDLIAIPCTDILKTDNIKLPSTQNELFSSISSFELIIKNIEDFERIDFRNIIH